MRSCLVCQTRWVAHHGVCAAVKEKCGIIVYAYARVLHIDLEAWDIPFCTEGPAKMQGLLAEVRYTVPAALPPSDWGTLAASGKALYSEDNRCI